MGTKGRIARWGGSLAIRIPKPIAEQWGVREGSAIEMFSEGGRVVLQREEYDLEALLAQINSDNIHPEQEFGASRGNEEW